MTSRQRSKESNEPLSLESKYLSQSLETKTQVDHNQDFQPMGTEKSMNESAYVLLEDTEVVLLSPSDDNHSNALPFQKWVDIKMRPLCKTKILDKHIEDETIDSHSMSGDQHDGKTDEKVIGDNASELQEEKKYTTATQSQSMGDLFCDRCDLVLNVSNERFGESEDVHTTANKNSYEYICIESKDNPRFDGTMSDCRRCDSLKCSKTSCLERTNQHGTMNRSDAALLVGAALLSQEKSLLHLQNFQLFIHEILREEMTNASQNETSNFDVKNGSLLKVYRCTSSILMTFSLPQVERAKLEIHSILKTGNTGNISSRIPDQRKRRVSTGDNFLDESKQNEIFGKDKTLSPKKKLKASYSNSFISKKRKSLNLLQEKTLAIQKLAPRHNEIPPCAELLYTLLRSDWQTLTNKMRSIMKQKKHNTTSFNSVSSQNEERKYKTELLFQERKDTKLFPVELTLEELYKRIQGAASHVDDNPIYNKTSQYTYILLPDDILLSKIAPFLQAKSLDSFRCSCRYLHNVLKSIVPGMKLRLYLHQIKSLEWMRRRECRNVSEGDILRKFYSSKPISFDFFNQSSNGHDLYRSLSAGAVLTLEDKMPHVEAEANCVNEKYPGNKWQIDTRTGNILRYFHDDNFFMESSSLISPTMQTRKIARGGLLCDDPGLGKTITVLSLILQTLGLKSTAHDNTYHSDSLEKLPTSKSRVDDDFIFEIYWKEGAAPEVRRMDMNRLFSKLRRSDVHSFYFEKPVDPIRDGAPDYNEIIEHPICFKDISEKINLEIYGDDFEIFCLDVNLVFHNAMVYNDEKSDIFQAAERLKQKFTRLVHEFKSQSVSAAHRCCSRQSDSPIAVALAQKSKQDLLDTLYPSGATLLVVPSTLLHHWEEQIEMHIDLAFCSHGKTPLIYRHKLGGKIKDNYNSISGAFETCDVSLAYLLCKKNGTHQPFLFIDKSPTYELPEPKFLAMFSIVLTTSQRMTLEWKNGNVQDEMRCSQSNPRKSVLLGNFRSFFDEVSLEACPLLKVHWLRLIVDEGHSMGKRSHNNSIQFASWITAQRRWVMTGTPTPQTASQNGLRNILGLLKFLQHDYFSSRFDGDRKWKQYISKNWNEFKIAPFFRVQHLLALFMVRHTKEDIEELPKPRFSHKYIDLSSNEVRAYNTLVSAVQANLITTTMKGKTSAWQDSLLNPRQCKHAQQALNNIRLTCCGGTSVVPELTQQNWDETVAFLRDLHQIGDIKVTVVENFLHRVVTEQLSSCMNCGFQLQTLFVLPCGDLVCTECIDNQTTSCPVCGDFFDVDDFQRLQPGLKYNWKWNIEDAQKKREAAANLREQLSQTTNNEAAEFRGEDQVLPSRIRGKKSHCCIFPKPFTNGKCIICHELHRECVFINSQSCCSICHAVAEECPKDESKAFYVVNRVLELFFSDEFCPSIPCPMSQTASRIVGEKFKVETKRPLKIIVFSQFRQILNVVGDRLLRRLGGGCVAEYWGSTRGIELEKFAKSPDCFVMLLGVDGSHGLDLSFVTHIFFLDEIWDKSLQSQVVARAYRMGATGHVDVMQLVARDSVEEIMIEMNKKKSKASLFHHVASDRNINIPFDLSYKSTKSHRNRTQEENNESRAKMYYLLKHAKFIKKNVVSAHRMTNKTIDIMKSIDKNTTNEKIQNERTIKLKKVRFS